MRIGIRNKDTSKSLFDMRLRKWKTIMASQNIISVAKQNNLRDKRKGKAVESDKHILQQFFKSKNEGDMLMETATDPEFIIWKNIGQTEHQRFLQNIFSYITVTLVIGITLFAIIQFKKYRQSEIGLILPMLGEKGLKGISCQAQVISKQEAFSKEKDFQELQLLKGESDKQKISFSMFCYCYNELTNNPFDFNEIEFTDMGKPDEEKYCSRFLDYFRIIQVY